jgi:uncharacterized membrane protein
MNRKVPMRPLCLLPLLLIAACNGGQGGNDPTSPAGGASAGAYAWIAEGELLRFTGTEPFWGGQVSGTTLRYETLENPKGTTITVRRFAGNNGLAFTGTLAGAAFDMAVTEAPCSDGMSDRAYPFTVTLTVGDEMRSGCGWTEARKFTGPEAP